MFVAVGRSSGLLCRFATGSQIVARRSSCWVGSSTLVQQTVPTLRAQLGVSRYVGSCDLGAVESKSSFAIVIVIARALPVQRDVRRDWTEQQLVMSCCDRLNDRSSTIKGMGQLEHSRAASFSRLHERNSASRSSQPFSGLEVHNLTSATLRLAVSWAYTGKTAFYRLEEG